MEQVAWQVSKYPFFFVVELESEQIDLLSPQKKKKNKVPSSNHWELN